MSSPKGPAERSLNEYLSPACRLIAVAQTEEILESLGRKTYDAAIGAITITPARLARVDFSYSRASFLAQGSPVWISPSADREAETGSRSPRAPDGPSDDSSRDRFGSARSLYHPYIRSLR
jgi:hypothetical protein